MGQELEFFKGSYILRGKHARMADELCHIKEPENNFFSRVVDVYIMAAIIGMRYDRKAAPDMSCDDTKTVFAEMIIKEKDTFDFLLQLMLVQEHARTLGGKEGIMKAFRGVQTKEEFLLYNQMFNDYVRGGVEELYEGLIVRKPEPDEEYMDEKTANMMYLLEKLRIK